MFQFPRCPPILSAWVTVHNHCRVSPFGNLRVKAYLQLSATYRSLSRPSSASIAKASTVCPYHLNLYTLAYAKVSTLQSSLRLVDISSLETPKLFLIKPRFLLLSSSQGAKDFFIKEVLRVKYPQS